MEHRVWAGIGFALFTAGLYGLNAPLARVAFLNGIPPHEAVLFRGLSLLLFSSFLVVLLREAVRLPREAWGVILGLGITTGLISVCYMSAVRFISVGLASIIFYTYPLIILLLAPIGEARAIGGMRLVLAAVAFAGLATAIGPSLSELQWPGIALAMAASLLAAGHAFLGRRASQWMGEVTNVFWTHCILVPTVLATAFVVNGEPALSALGGNAVHVVGMVAVGTMCVAYVVGYLSHMRALRLAPTSITAPFFNLEPVVAIVVATVLLRETLAFNQYAGGALVLGALMVSSVVKDKKAVAEEAPVR